MLRHAHKRVAALRNIPKELFLVVALVLLALSLFFITPGIQNSAFVSSEVKFTDASPRGLSIVPASCPSGPHPGFGCSCDPPQMVAGQCQTECRSNVNETVILDPSQCAGCPPGLHWDMQTSQCACNNPHQFTMNGQNCLQLCPDGTIPLNNHCPTGPYLCDDGSTPVNFQCPTSPPLPPPSCENGLNIAQYPSCVCPSGQVQSGDHCVAGTAPTCSIIPAASTIQAGQSQTLTWTSSSDAVSAQILPSPGAVPPNGSGGFSPTQTTVYQMDVVDAQSHVGHCSATITVGTGVAPTVELSQNKPVTRPGEMWTLSWSSTGNPTSCSMEAWRPDGSHVPSWDPGAGGSTQFFHTMLGQFKWKYQCFNSFGASEIEYLYHQVSNNPPSPTPPPTSGDDCAVWETRTETTCGQIDPATGACMNNGTNTYQVCTVWCQHVNFCEGDNLVNGDPTYGHCPRSYERCTNGCNEGAAACYPPPAITEWDVRPTLVRRNDTSNVRWRAEWVRNCQVGRAGSVGIDQWPGGCSGTACQGQKVTSPIPTQSIYRITCTGLAITDPIILTDEDTVNVVPEFEER